MNASGRAVIFDVDGVLLDLTAAEEDLFFACFSPWGDPARLSRDWNSYRIRNDDDIVDEIMAGWGIPAAEKPAIVARYFDQLQAHLDSGRLASPALPGAAETLAALQGKARLGIATANLREAARLRLAAAGLWPAVSGLAFGADGGGHKHEILARAIAASGLPPASVIYVGDNLNDVEAGLRNGVTFIGFSTSSTRRSQLQAAGAIFCAQDHTEMRAFISARLNA